MIVMLAGIAPLATRTYSSVGSGLMVEEAATAVRERRRVEPGCSGSTLLLFHAFTNDLFRFLKR